MEDLELAREWLIRHRANWSDKTVQKSLAVLLAKVRLEEAKWWEPYVPDFYLTTAERRMMAERISALEQQLSGKEPHAKSS